MLLGEKETIMSSSCLVNVVLLALVTCNGDRKQSFSAEKGGIRATVRSMSDYTGELVSTWHKFVFKHVFFTTTTTVTWWKLFNFIVFCISKTHIRLPVFKWHVKLQMSNRVSTWASRGSANHHHKKCICCFGCSLALNFLKFTSSYITQRGQDMCVVWLAGLSQYQHCVIAELVLCYLYSMWLAPRRLPACLHGSSDLHSCRTAGIFTHNSWVLQWKRKTCTI